MAPDKSSQTPKVLGDKTNRDDTQDAPPSPPSQPASDTSMFDGVPGLTPEPEKSPPPKSESSRSVESAIRASIELAHMMHAAANVGENLPADLIMRDIVGDEAFSSLEPSATPSDQPMPDADQTQASGHGHDPLEVADSTASSEAEFEPAALDSDPVGPNPGEEDSSDSTEANPFAYFPLPFSPPGSEGDDNLSIGSSPPGHRPGSPVVMTEPTEDQHYCCMCDERIWANPGEGPAEKRAYLPCGHNLGHRCLFRFLEAVPPNGGVCPYPSCSCSIRHLCQHVAAPTADPPHRPLTETAEDGIAWNYEFCQTDAGEAAQRAIAQLVDKLRWTEEEQRTMPRDRRSWVLQALYKYRLHLLTLAEKKLDRLHRDWWQEKKEKFVEDNRRRRRPVARLWPLRSKKSATVGGRR